MGLCMNSWTTPPFFPNPCVLKLLLSRASQLIVSDFPTIWRTFLLKITEEHTQLLNLILTCKFSSSKPDFSLCLQCLNISGFLVELKWIRLAIGVGPPQYLKNTAVSTRFAVNSRSTECRAHPSIPGPTEPPSQYMDFGFISHILGLLGIMSDTAVDKAKAEFKSQLHHFLSTVP